MNKIEIIKTKTEWDAFIKGVGSYDVYHTYDYHHIDKEKDDEAVLLKYTNNGVHIGLPILIRKIKNSKYYDAISVYGYSGPIGSRLPMEFDTSNYEKNLLDFFKENNIVSVFMRLNPYIKFQNILFSKLGSSSAYDELSYFDEVSYFGELSYLGKIVNINLSKSLENQRQKFSRRLKTYLNKANTLLTLKVAETEDDFNSFKSLYYDNMKRVNAKKHYFFSDNYFNQIISSKDFKTEVLLAIDNDTKKVIAGCMFILTNKMVQYHLAGADKDFLHLNATKFLIDQMRIRATKKGYKYFNLGGGLGANENDSLFQFKSSFSDEYHPFFVWKLVTNNKIYYEICKKNNVIENSSSFFPLYRLKEHEH